LLAWSGHQTVVDNHKVETVFIPNLQAHKC